MMKNPWIIIDDGCVEVDFHGLQDLNDAIQIMKDNNLVDCKVYLNCGALRHGDELAFVDNISYLEEIAKLGFNINFYYSSNLEHEISLKSVIEDEKKLDLMCKEIKNSNLSPLEKFIAVYNLVHFFKPYKKENEKEMSGTLSRNLYEYLNNDYMVCEGYADLLENLCKRVGIPCAYYGLEPVDRMDGHGHARNYVYLDDSKYNINGFYISDSTQAIQMKRVGNFPVINNCKNILMTTIEQQYENRYNPEDGFKLLDYSKEEFFKLLESKGENYIKFLLVGDIKKIDVEFGNQLYNMNFENSEDVEKAWDYISSKINNPISNEKLLNALMESIKVLYPKITESELSDLKFLYSKMMGVQQEELDVSKMTLKDIKLQHPAYYASSEMLEIINEGLQTSYDNLTIYWSKEAETLKAIGPPTSRILENQETIINNGYQIIFSATGRINIQFPIIHNKDTLTIEEYRILLNKQIQDFLTMISRLSYDYNKEEMSREQLKGDYSNDELQGFGR